MTLRERIEAARKAQQLHEQKHDVQLEMTIGEIEEEERWAEHTKERIRVMDNHSKSEKV